MSSTQVDFISPKNSPYVTINDTAVIPASTSISVAVTGAAATQTITGSAYAFGKINVIQLHPLTSFTGTTNSPVLSFSIAGLGISLPAQTVYSPCINTLDGTTEIGYASIDSAGTVLIAAVPAGTGFTDAKVASVYATVIVYASA